MDVSSKSLEVKDGGVRAWFTLIVCSLLYIVAFYVS